jgi:hypothetical protein
VAGLLPLLLLLKGQTGLCSNLRHACNIGNDISSLPSLQQLLC